VARVGPRGRRRRPDPEDAEDADLDEDEADEDPEETADEPSTSLEDLTSEADPNQFDQTFRDDDALLDIQGAFDPVAGSKQVIPRVAYTINYNFVWNPDRGRWEPDEGNDNAGANPASLIHVSFGTFPSIPGDGTATTVPFDAVQYDSLDGADLATNSIEFTEAGLYSIRAQVQFNSLDAQAEVTVEDAGNASPDALAKDITVSAGAQAITTATVFPRDSGETISLSVSQDSGFADVLDGTPSNTYLTVARIGPKP
jgi:hypothetical protein